MLALLELAPVGFPVSPMVRQPQVAVLRLDEPARSRAVSYFDRRGRIAAARRAVHYMSAAQAADVDELCGVLPEEVCDDIAADADAIFAVIDEDGNGAITRAELTKHLMKAGYTAKACDLVFDKVDTDKSEEISQDELRAAFLQYSPLREAPGLGAYNAQFLEEIHTDADALFAAIDTDGSGEISKDELRNHLKEFSSYSFKAIGKIFKMLDGDGDNSITQSEMRDAFVKYSALRQAIGEGPNFK